MQPLAERITFQAWLDERDAAVRHQPPHLELLAEHHLMAIVLDAMAAEAEALQRGEPRRADVWRLVADFNGTFVHRCHRAKEEGHLLPALAAAGLLPAAAEAAVAHEHATAKDLTFGLGDGVADGDWERVQRVVSIYVHLMRAHMRHEEGLFGAATDLPAAATQRLRREFDAIERKALGGGGRDHFVAVARQLAAATRVHGDFGVGG